MVDLEYLVREQVPRGPLGQEAEGAESILEKPEVEEIKGLSPIIAIEQKTTGNNPRSTVGTITEIYDFLRLLYAKGSRAFSPETGKEMVRYTDEQIVDLIMTQYGGRKCYLLAPLVRGRKGHYRELFDQMRKRGYTDVRIDGEIFELQSVTALDRYKPHFIELVVDRLKPEAGDDKRIRDSVARALNIGKGSVAVLDMETEKLAHFSKHLVDPDSGLSLQEPQPHSFSFNSPQGYCPHCKGLGTIVDVNMDSIIPDRSLSVADGAIVPLGKVRENRKFDIIRSIARKYSFSLLMMRPAMHTSWKLPSSGLKPAAISAVVVFTGYMGAGYGLMPSSRSFPKDSLLPSSCSLSS